MISWSWSSGFSLPLIPLSVTNFNVLNLFKPQTG